jgi:phage tail sheath gpL-like
MTVSFNEIPSDILTPGHFVEIDPTGAIEGTGARPHTGLIIGYRYDGGATADSSTITQPDGTTAATLWSGTVEENIPTRVTRASDAQGFFGKGSQAAIMAEAWLNVNSRTKLYVMGIDDPAGTEASGTITFTASTPSAGVQNCYISGTRYQVSVATDSTATTLGDSLEALVNADTDGTTTAVNAAGTVTLTARHPGPEGNDIDLRVNYRDTDSTPAGVTAVAVAMSGGATSVDLSTAIAALGGTQYDTIVSGLADDANMILLENELVDRWGPMVNLDGHLFVGFAGTQGETTTYTAAPARNSEQSTVCCAQESPTPPWVVGANVAGLDAAATTDDPARPRTTLRCQDVLAPEAGAVWSQTERNIVLQSGGATLKPDAGGNVIIERLTTTYQKSAQGAPDPTWLDLTTKRTVSYLRWSWDTRITLKFPRHKLASDGTAFDAGQAVVTPSTIRAEAIAWFSEMENAGLVEDLDQFREDLIVERNTTDLNRIDAILRPNTINKFVVSATKLQFKL